MCGLTGFFLPRGGSVDPAALSSMTQALAHRGPDADGMWISSDGRAGLGHRRLSILDLSPAGAQPMRSSSNRYTCAFNGEIYNFAALRSELAALGHAFRGHSDTEVLLACCEQWGVIASLPRLSGMFALAIHDAVDNCMHLVRDRLGVKPIAWREVPGGIAFASEVRPLANLAPRPSIDRESVAIYLNLGYVPAPHSIHSGIAKLEAGCMLTVATDGTKRPRRWWDLDDAIAQAREHPFTGNLDEAAEALVPLLDQAVRSRLVADVPLGAFLSGGIDSSAVAALMRRHGQVRTFTVGFAEAEYDESLFAARVAGHLGCDHAAIIATPDDALAVVPRIPRICDEPFADASLIPTWLVAGFARRYVTVALSGDGGDELFAGYDRYRFTAAAWGKLRRLPQAVRSAAGAVISAVPPDWWDALPRRLLPPLPGQKAVKLARLLAATDQTALHRAAVALWPDADRLVAGCDAERLAAAWPPRSSRHPLVSVEAQQFADTLSYMPEDVLVKVDRATMSHGLEAREPLLDLPVLDFAWRLPTALKLGPGGGKLVLRRALHRLIPRELVERPKRGFSIPLDDWLRGPLRGWAEGLLDPALLARDGLLNPEPIRHAWEAHLARRANRGGALWAVLMLQAWRNDQG